MHDIDSLADLPEALPLRRVSPLWRVFALMQAVALIGLLLVLFVLGIALLQFRTRPPMMGATVAPPGMRFAPVVPSPPGQEEPTDPQSLPYPTHEDLRAAVPPEQNPAGSVEASSLRQRFLAKGEEVWRNPKGQYPSKVSVSPDGQKLAYVTGEELVAGTFQHPTLLGDNLHAGQGKVTGAPMAMPPGMMPGAMPTGDEGKGPETRLVGPPAWTSDNNQLYVARRGGSLLHYHYEPSVGEILPFRGESPVPLPSDPRKLIFVRARPTAKLDAVETPALADLTEVVLADLETNRERILIPASPVSWSSLSISPDGKQLALVSDRSQEGRQPRLFRVFLANLAEQDKALEPQPLTPPAAVVGPICWTPDGKALIYARSQDPLPSDAPGGEPSRLHRAMDLFQWDLDSMRETRLSRGGGFYSPSMATVQDGTLFYLTWEPDEAGQHVRLRRMALSAARQFAAEVPSPISQDATAWTALIDNCLEAAQVSPEADGSPLTAEALARLAETFARLYGERFQASSPSTGEQFDRTWQSLRGLALPDQARTRLAVVLGAAEGEYLHRHHGGAWHLAKGPLVRSWAADQPGTHNPFGLIVNPFQLASLPEPGKQTGIDHVAPRRLTAILEKAEGRALVLTNDAEAGKSVLAALVDPDLARAAELFQVGSGDAAEQLLLKMLDQERHKKNAYLAVQVATLLYEHHRRPALRRLMERVSQEKPYNARKFNFLGLAYLRDAEQATDPQARPQVAVEAFKNALRCDLHYGPAYLNLAQAYEESGNANAARQCLQRYLQLMPEGAFAEDARRRLGMLPGSTGP